MKKLVIITFSDNEFKESLLIRLPSSVRKEQVEKIVEDVRNNKLENYNLPEDWTYDDVTEVIVDELGGEFVEDFLHWEFYL